MMPLEASCLRKSNMNETNETWNVEIVFDLSMNKLEHKGGLPLLCC